MQIKSPAKLNLILKVVDKLPNNYHLLEMFNVLIDLEDIIEIKEASHTNINYDKYTIEKENDIIYKVVTKFIETYQLPNQDIYIIKNIPVGAGLGGVSSNVATIINFLNSFYRLGLTLQELIDFVLPYGTDICFLLYNKKAIVKGIGEIIETIDYNINKQILIIYPNIKIETKYIYNKVRQVSECKVTKNYVLNNNIVDILENDLEPVVFENISNMKEIYETLKKDISNIHMSGSGSTFYSIIEKEIDIEEITKKYPEFLIRICNIYN